MSGLFSRRLAWLMLPALALFIGAIYLASARILLGGFQNVERDNTMRNIERVQSAHRNALENIGSIAQAWARWDEARDYVLKPDTASSRQYEEVELGTGAIDQTGVNVVVHSGPSRRLVFQTGFDLKTHRKTPLPAGLREHLRPDSPLLQPIPLSGARYGVLRLPEGLLLLAARPITFSDGRGPAAGNLIMGRWLNSDVKKQWSQQVKLPVAVYAIDDKNLPPDFLQASVELLARSGQNANALADNKTSGASTRAQPDRLVRLLNDEAIAGYALMRDLYGKPAFLMRVAVPRNIYRQGQASLYTLLLALLTIGATSGAILMALQMALSGQARRRQADAELYRLLALNSSDVLFQFELPSEKFSWFGDMETLLGKNEDSVRTLSDWLACLDSQDREMCETKLRACCVSGEAFSGEYRANRSDESDVYLLVRGKPVRGKSGRIERFVGACTDISARRRSEMDKEVLLKEIHHRVKNNMQVISSMLNLQASHIADAATRDLFQDSQNRIRSMALIHERLYQQHDLASVNFADYLGQLAASLVRSYRTGAVELKTQLDSVPLDIDSAMPCGLIVNELVSNALKHAFKGRKNGCLSISLHRQDARVLAKGEDEQSATQSIVLIVEDDGIGFPENLDWRDVDSLGLQLVGDFTEQLRGTIAMERGFLQDENGAHGTRWTLTFASQNEEK